MVNYFIRQTTYIIYLFLTERLSWHSSSSITLRDSLESNSNQNNENNNKQQKTNKHYAEDSGIGLHEEDDDDTLADGEEEVKKDKAFLCQTLYQNKRKDKNILNFEKGVLLKVIHVDDSGEWWFAINEDNQKRGWVDPAYVSRLD
jgi:hypothetical protein